MNQLSPIVLASKSPRRRLLLEGLGLDFRVMPSHIDEERKAGESSEQFARRAALEKGVDVMRRLEQEGDAPWIVCADTVVVLGGEILTKPRNAEQAVSMTRRLSGKCHHVVTGWAVGRSGEPWHQEHAETAVWFHALSDEQILSYAATGEGMDKAGAYAIQGVGAFLVKRIEGCYFNVVGLPVSRVVRALVEVGALPRYPIQ
jgi:septum formation protein